MVQLADYNGAAKICYQHPDWTRPMTNFSRVPLKKALYRSGETGSRRKRAIWRPEKKNMSSMKDFVKKFTRIEDM